ncbi:hypothetical protein BDQ94DRAFT_132130 [Aspergillus welwitschiae]|uniref:Uncharacterized protein n=1 Tax=Aspergillus welwitschiae TaxID=1341132 RepID=A0A3F3QI92_9EURO|nr:hypothetical protein BDQ94DRAFT_132130 [Aspergillus welwitschiae]RDH38983.1 hypothetical protein BDQ94DRAFT_132130 [Aspergillus welwitschiae]
MENPSKFSEENERGETILSGVIMTASILPNSMGVQKLAPQTRSELRTVRVSYVRVQHFLHFLLSTEPQVTN